MHVILTTAWDYEVSIEKMVQEQYWMVDEIPPMLERLVVVGGEGGGGGGALGGYGE